VPLDRVQLEFSSTPVNRDVKRGGQRVAASDRNTIPVLAVRDLDRSIAFYKDVLGFEVEWNAGVICSVARDHCSIMLQVSDAPGTGTVWIGLEGESLFAALEKSEAKILQPPSNEPWAYEMKIADPDGNVVWLGAEPKVQ
jgi:catechol 2,3-dioxygenase-like lactoylglutathione lyase family enzyme